ncbi:MAG: radical SAM family heme chaperone HemW, partial [Actinomycetes bacterium]|nr:radical SAM family heme chaperone HemW [Actinomycetes bacterium]
PPRPVSTVFLGGGTPTLLPAPDLVRMLDAVRDAWGLVPGAEVTTEANPDTVDEAYLEHLAAAGFTRLSLGMQSAVPHVLATLDRTHTPANVGRAVTAARAVGLDVSLDLIYGTPGESLADWRRSIAVALALEPDHVSAYALGIEEGTRMGVQVRRGELPPTDPDDQAEKYEAVDAALSAAGLPWYEISNWARPGHESRHNLAYWRGEDWWGIGPGAHSHIQGVRFWNVKHPRVHAARLSEGRSPSAGREILSAEDRRFERLMLGVRLAEGLAVDDRGTLRWLVEEGLAEAAPAAAGRVVLTLRGRLLADSVTHRLAGS